jgi:pimeloyl-ACP methyl ester carboxylesterase
MALSWGPVMAALGGATHIIVQGSGHAVHQHDPALVADAILSCGQ